jgi:hypothetical protein
MQYQHHKQKMGESPIPPIRGAAQSVSQNFEV